MLDKLISFRDCWYKFWYQK